MNCIDVWGGCSIRYSEPLVSFNLSEDNVSSNFFCFTTETDQVVDLSADVSHQPRILVSQIALREQLYQMDKKDFFSFKQSQVQQLLTIIHP
jgi:hypothetical protein